MELHRLREIRIEKGLTQIEVAKMVGVSLMAYRLWEMGGNEPNRKNYEKLLEALEILPFTDEPQNKANRGE
jgi:transcriptional regulator with XRE-family HTH domain